MTLKNSTADLGQPWIMTIASASGRDLQHGDVTLHVGPVRLWEREKAW